MDTQFLISWFICGGIATILYIIICITEKEFTLIDIVTCIAYLFLGYLSLFTVLFGFTITVVLPKLEDIKIWKHK